MRRLPTVVTALSAATLLTVSACAGAPKDTSADKTKAAGNYPVTITSCDTKVTVEKKPTKAVTLNQGATEVALALGLEKQLAGTAYFDDPAPAPAIKKAYDSVKVLAKEYPSREQFLAVKPDFAYGSYASAFEKKAVGTQQELKSSGVNSYLSPLGCAKKSDRPTPSFDAVWKEIADVAEIFDVPERAEKLRREQEATLAKLKSEAAGKDTRVLWFDSGDKTALIGAGQGGPHIVMHSVGATNVFADVPGAWEKQSWEKVIAADPDVIVLADAAWSSAKEKIAKLQKDPVLSQMRAVKNKKFITIPYSASTPGVRLIDGAESLGKQLKGLSAS